MMIREVSLFEQAVIKGDEGLVGIDGSGNDPEFPQQLGSTAVDKALFENESPEEA